MSIQKLPEKDVPTHIWLLFHLDNDKSSKQVISIWLRRLKARPVVRDGHPHISIMGTSTDGLSIVHCVTREIKVVDITDVGIIQATV
jgi:hypothetical protein